MEDTIEYTKQKVANFFEEFPDKVHGFDHAKRVAEYAAHIATEEDVDIFMCTLAGWLHDIGRAVEEYPEKFSTYDATKTHHELSYELLRDWFREDESFLVLTDEQKIELLYAVRYHWNDEASEYPSAYILRDADKIDGLGEVGVARQKMHTGDKEKETHLALRLRYEWIYNFKTKTAKRMFEEMDLIVPINKELRGFLRENIKPIEL